MLQKIQHYADLVKFEHTVFALPFALSAVLLASGPQWPSLNVVLWVVLAMVGGRTFAMGMNRIIDINIDGKNPRTQNRALPAGRVKIAEAWGLSILALILMVVATFQLPVICRQLLPIALAILILYSYVKRFSNMAHLVLGLALGSSAIGGWIAVTGELSWTALLFGLGVLFWVAGFDIIYACQDVDFDRSHGLFSIPASWSIKTGLRISRVFHVFTVLCLIAVGLLHPYISGIYWGAVGLVAFMLYYEHTLVSDKDLSRVDEAFFMVNGQISLGVMGLIFADKVALVQHLLN
jgi:4-hydroxybenzoate polyprenyltransferase